MRQTLSALFLGVVAGAILVSLFSASRLEQLYWEKEKLRVDLFEATERLHKVESLLATHKEGEILSATIKLESEENAFTELELRQQIGEITSDIVGTQIDTLNPDLLISLLQGRRLTVEGKYYLIDVAWVIIAQNTVFNLIVLPAAD